MIDDVRLRPLRPEEFEAFLQADLAQYVADMVANAGLRHTEAEAKAQRDQTAALPAGFATPGHTFSVIEDARSGAALGRLWFAEQAPAVYVYDIFLEPWARGRGLGRQVMLLLEQETRRRGLERIELNVFGGNAVARRLYRSLGYAEVAVAMRKDLQPDAADYTRAGDDLA